VVVHQFCKGMCAPSLELRNDECIGEIYVDEGPVDRLRAVSDRLGRFAIRGSSGLPMLSLQAVKPGYIQVPQDDFLFHPGDGDARVVLARPAEVR
jgi:hypothetical protein